MCVCASVCVCVWDEGRKVKEKPKQRLEKGSGERWINDFGFTKMVGRKHI